MVKFITVRPIINKSNKQINICLPKKQLPQKFKSIISKSPSDIRALKLKIEGWE